MVKENVFCMKYNPAVSPVFNISPVISVKGRLIDLSEPQVMGILNLTTDSFYDGGKFIENKAIVRQAGKMIREGATFIDVGAASSRPGAKTVSARSELNRLIPAIQSVLDRYPDALISVDTFHARVAVKCIEAGAAIINDISSGDLDPDMMPAAGSLGVPFIAMHMQGTPKTMQVNPVYKNVTSEVLSYLLKKASDLRDAGVRDIILDPGFGFGKTVEHNYTLLNNLQVFVSAGFPVLAGLSRKSMICKVLGVNPEKALNGTTALNMVALQNGASILRVHDVREAVETIKLFKSVRKNKIPDHW